jgi:hypothetical protein
VLARAVQVSSPFEVAEFDIIFGEGINALGSVVDTAKEIGVLEARVSGVVNGGGGGQCGGGGGWCGEG